MSARGETIAVVGGGNMGEALIAGWMSAGHHVVVVEMNNVRADQLRERYDLEVVALAETAAAETKVLAVKPGPAVGVAAELPLRPGDLLISVAAGVSTKQLSEAVPNGVDVVRVMPNTPALVGQGMSVLSGASDCQAAALEVAADLMRAVGQVAIVPESQQDAVTAVSGSGPAYFFLVVEAMIDAGVDLGLSPEIATQLATQTAVGAAAMLAESVDSAATLRAKVTSPGGTTAAAIEALEHDGLRSMFAAAMRAAARRSAELGS